MSILGSIFGNGSPFGINDNVHAQQQLYEQYIRSQFYDKQQPVQPEKKYKKFNIDEEDIVDAEFYIIGQNALPEPPT